MLLTKRWLNWVTPKCLLRTIPQDQHFEYGETHGERLLDIFKRSATTLEEQQGCLVARIKMARNRMYKLNLRSIQEKCLQVNIEDKASLWHLHFGHLHHGGLKELVNKNMVHELPNMDYEGKFCEEFVLNKHVKTSFPKKAQY